MGGHLLAGYHGADENRAEVTPSMAMSPSRGTQRRSVRIPDQLWTAAAARARAEGVSVSDVIRAALEAYVSGGESCSPPIPRNRASRASGADTHPLDKPEP